MPADPMPTPPDATAVMNKLVIVGNLFEQIEKAAGDVAAEVVQYRAEYGEWEREVSAWARRQDGG